MPSRRMLTKVMALAGVGAVLAGCRITGPDFDQTFANRSTPIPMKATVTHTLYPVRFECHQAYHGGLYPAFEEGTWVFVTNATPTPSGEYYSASASAVLPASCWRQDYTGVWYSAVRARQRNSDGTMPSEGFPSLKTYANSDQYIPWIRVKANG